MKKLLIVFVFVIGVLVAGKNFFVKVAVENGVKAVTGLSLNIVELNISIMSTQVGIKGLSLMNPEGFPQEAMFYSPEIFVDYNLSDIIRGNVHLEEVRLDFDQFVIVKNAQGQTNWEALKLQGKSLSKDSSDANDSDKKKVPEFQIDRLSLKVGKVIYEDYSRGPKPDIKEYEINLSEEMTNVTSVQSILGTVVTKALAKTALNSLIDFNVDVLKDASAVPGQVVNTLKSTVDTLKNTIKLPFGAN